jgi:sugar phosphate isomerase/epimerase
MLTRRLGIDAQTVFGMPPIEYVNLAADLGCSHIGAALVPVPWRLARFADWSVRDDVQLRRDLLAVLRDRDISLLQAEGFSVRQALDVGSYAADLDIFAELGAVQASGVCMERDRNRALDQLTKLAQMTAARGLRFALEFAPPHAINTLPQALAALEEIGHPNVRLVIDAMHFFRSGGQIAQLQALTSETIGYVQLCDVPRQPACADYFDEACFQRRLPGEGELPLEAFCAALPKEVPVGLEVPMQERAEQATSFQALLAPAVLTARRLLK